MQHFLRISDFSRSELLQVLDRAAELKKFVKEGVPHPTLQGQSLGMIFEKSSTRTRVSFQVGMYQLGGQALFLSSRDIQIGRGEPIRDTARVLSRYLDGIMIRTFDQKTVEELAEYATIPIINGLTDLVHPCQIVSDLLTIKEHLGGVAGKTVAWVGDGNNMAHSWLYAAGLLGFHIKLACPQGYKPDENIVAWAKDKGAHVEIFDDAASAVKDAHILNTDVWTSMGQEAETEARLKAFQGYELNEALCSTADPKHIVMHCLPAHRGEEVAENVFEGSHSVVWDQAENRLHAQKAIMDKLMRK